MSPPSAALADLPIFSTQKNVTPEEKSAFLTTLPPHAVQPLWEVMSAVVPPFPNPKANPHLWSYRKLRPLLLESGRLVPTSEAERRVLMLINPALKAPQTTDTLYAGLQLILPGETAPAHRHIAFALRFIIEGNKGFTAVDGDKIYMNKGDVILTPSWTWHDHGHEGDGPMVWLDGLDLPVWQALPVNFAEMYAEDRYPSEVSPVKSPLSFPWAPVQESLDKQGGDYARYRYTLPGGVHLSKVIGACAERIAKGTISPVQRETSSKVFHVYQGKGYSIVSGEGQKEERLDWETADTFAVPHWRKVQHFAEDGEDAYLFSFNDRPLMEAVGAFKTEGQIVDEAIEN